MIDFAMFHFLRPFWLLALLPWLVLVVLTIRHRLSRGQWSEVCDEPLLPYLLEDRPAQAGRFGLTAGALASLLAIVALAGPTWERLPTPTFRDDSAVVIALDLSRSMDAADLKPSRLERARFKIADILKQRKDGQTALLVYAGDAFTVTPLTSDTRTIASQLPALTTDIMPAQGSDTVAALQLAVDLLKQAGLQKGHILLVTDGVDVERTAGAVERLGAYSLSILGVGTAEGAPIKAGGSGFVKDRHGTIVVPKLQADALQRLAALGNGVYRTIVPNDSDIDALLAAFDNRLARNDSTGDAVLLELWLERGPWLLLLVVPLAALSFRKGVWAVVGLAVLPFPNEAQAFDWADLWKTPNQQAQQAFDTGRYERAAELYDDPAWKAAAEYKAGRYDRALDILNDDDSVRGHYNRGNALAQSGRLKEAIDAYDQALQLDPNHEDAAYNKALVEKELERRQSQSPQQNQPNESNRQDADRQQQEQPSSEANEAGAPSEPSEQHNSEDGEASDAQEPTQPSVDPKPSPTDEDGEETEPREFDETEQPMDESDRSDAANSTPKSAGTAEPADEAKQASEQWLKRIPDDPAGLLRRKFEYQYGRRGRQQQSEEAW